MRCTRGFTAVSRRPSILASVAYDTSCRSAARQLLNTSKTRRRPRFSHSSPNRRSARSTTVAAQRTSKTLSGDHLSDSSSGIDKWDGASVIQSSQETKRKSPPHRCDLIKFAKYEATTSDSELLLEEAIRFLKGGQLATV